MQRETQFAASLQSARMAKKLTQRRAAELLHAKTGARLGPSGISKVEAGKRVPKPEVTAALADLYGIPAPERTLLVEQARAAHPLGASERDALAADLGKRYERGASIRGLVAETGMGYGTVHTLLSHAKVKFRPAYTPRGDADSHDTSLGALLQRARIAARLSQEDACERVRRAGVHLHRQRLQDFEHGRRVPKPNVVEALADAYGVVEPKRTRLVEMACSARAAGGQLAQAKGIGAPKAH